MKKFKNVLANCTLIDIIGTVILISLISLLLILFIFYSHNYIAHFCIAAIFPIIEVKENGVNKVNKYPQTSLLKEEMIEESFNNNLFRKNIKKHIAKQNAKNFILVKKENEIGVIYF